MRALLLVLGMLLPAAHGQQLAFGDAIAWRTNLQAVFAIRQVATQTNQTNQTQASLTTPTGESFSHFLPGSLQNLLWTNILALTNGPNRSTVLWSVRRHPVDWPTNPPALAWNTNCLAWGMKGLTAISPCWESEGSSGQVPVTALTRRHGYTRGHGMGPDSFNKGFAGRKVWFLAANNTLVETTVLRDVVRTGGGSGRDYTILLFSKDLPASIEPMRAVDLTSISTRSPYVPGAPRPILQTEAGGNISAGLPGFTVPTWKGGDSGSPDMLPMPGELIFFGGRSTSGPSPEMQNDMNILCSMEGLKTNRYQLRWLDLSPFPTYGAR